MMMSLRRPALALAVSVVTAFGLCGVAASEQEESKRDANYPHQILIIRHGEKTGDKTDIHLNDQGKHRAEVLDQLFIASKSRPNPFPKPHFIIAADASKDSNRPVETVTPLSLKLNLHIDHRFKSKIPDPSKKDAKEKKAKALYMADLKHELFHETKYFGKVVLIAWRHSVIPELAKALKVNNAPAKWEEAVFDRVWQITYDERGTATFVDRPQRLLPGDTEK